MNSEWSLDALYAGYDDPRYGEDVKRLDELCASFNALVNEFDKHSAVDNLVELLTLKEGIDEVGAKLFIYSSLRTSANTRDAEGASWSGKLMTKMSSITKASTAADKYIAGLDNLDELIASHPMLTEYEYLLSNIKADSKYLLSDDVEEVMALYNISGGRAWGNLQSSLTSSVTADFRGEKVNLSAIRNKAYDPDAAVRKEAYEAELACYEKIEDAVAMALNSIKLQVINEAKLRGFESPLAQTLHQSKMKRETLDALIEAMTEYMPKFWEYLRAKAKLLGHKDGMPWYDMFAPVGSLDEQFTVEQARDYLLKIFGTFDADLTEMVRRAFDEAWIDFYPREGKVGGAFCYGIQPIKQSRILTNFDGSFSDVVTLAHELGHAYHNLNIENNRILNTDYSMPVAETASTFNENVIMNAAIADATDPKVKLGLIESQLMDATQIICDIYSRYLFETAVFENRREQLMMPKALCEIMLDAQRKAYGDGLDHNYLHPYMWVCKSHYYRSGLSFYNFPYAFGGLFARGLYAKYVEEGEAFVDSYKKLLNATTVMSVEDTAKIAGIDLTDKAFWKMGLESFARQIDEFVKLAEEIAE